MAVNGQATGWPNRLMRRALEAYLLSPLFALVMVIFVWGTVYHLIQIERANVTRDITESIMELAETYEAQMIRNLDAIDQSLKTIKFTYEMSDSKPSLSMLQEKGLLPPSLIFSAAVADRNGDVIASTHPSEAYNVGSSPGFQMHRDTDLKKSIINSADSAGTEGKVQFSRRINAPDGSFAGMVMIMVEPYYFTSSYERTRLGEHGVIGLIAENGVFLARRSGYAESSGETANGLDDDNGQTFLAVNPWDGVQRYVQTRQLFGFPLTLVVGLSRVEQMEAFERQKSTYMWGAMAATVVLVLAAALLSRLSLQLARSRTRTRKDQETFFAASEAILDAIFILRTLFDSRGRIVDFAIDNANESGARMLGRQKVEIIGKQLRVLMPPHIAEHMVELFAEVVRTGIAKEREWENEFPGIRATWLYEQVVKVEDGVVAIVRDISERKLTEERINYMAHHDALTGLPNRVLLEDRIRQAISHAQRYGRSLAVVFIDLDDFKLVNDSLGHKVGDELLKVLANRMLQCVRQSDTVVRLGGDEFVIVLSDQPGTPEALTPSLQRIREAISEPVYLAGQKLEVSSSIGLAVYPRDGSDGDTLLMNADTAMYQAKAAGRNSYQFFAVEMNQKIHERLALQEGLRSAVAQNEFFLVYQPQYDLRTCSIVGVEALIRWAHPDMGLIAPLDFIALAEENGMIVPIGEWVLNTACRQARAWQDAGLPPLVMSVNVSARQFRENNLVSQVEAALQQSGLDARYLELELTESLLMQNMQHAVSVMNALRTLGVRLSIDDFGSGYSSLAALKSFPIARLKLDRMFVRDLPGNEDDRAIALTVVSLGHALELKVLAEGIETAGQLAFLQEHGCDEGQGHFFCMPVSADEVAAFLGKSQFPQFLALKH